MCQSHGAALCCAVAEQAKYLERKLKLQQHEDADDDEHQQDEGEEEGGKKLWGANKRAYYNADTADFEVRGHHTAAHAAHCSLCSIADSSFLLASLPMTV